MKGTTSDLDFTRSDRDIVLANGVVQLKLVFRDGGYFQEFYGIDRQRRYRLLLSTIQRNLIPFTEHRITADPMLSCRRRHLFEVNRESLRMAYSDAQVKKNEDGVAVRLSGKSAEHKLSSTITLVPDSKFVRVTMQAEFASEPRRPIIEYLMAAYAFLPDGLLLDHYRRLDYAWAPFLRPMDDHIIGERSFSSAAVVVQRGKLLAAIIPDVQYPRPYPVALDLDLKNGLLSVPLLSYGICSSEKDTQFSYHDRSMLLHPERGVISCRFWLYLDADAKKRGGFDPIQEFLWSCAQRDADHSRHPGQPSEADDLPSAYVLKFGRQSQEDTQRADKIIERTVASQGPKGAFRLGGFDNGPGPYDTALMSGTARWLLTIYRDIDPSPQALDSCRSYGDLLANCQLTSGSIPSWLSDDLHILPELRDCAQTAASGRFLVELYEVTGERKYLSTARKAGAFVSSLVSKRRYHDRDAFLAGALTVRDEHTSILPQSAAAIRYVADLLVALYRVTGEAKYVKDGMTAVAQMLWYQDTWSDNPGGFAAGNSFDAPTCNAAFGRTLLEYYAAVGRLHYIERGLAAVRRGLAEGDIEAAAIHSWAVRRFGSALVDVRGRTAFAIGLCNIDEYTFKPGAISLQMSNGYHLNDRHPVRVRFCGMRGESYRISINGEGKRYPKVELEKGIPVDLG